VEDPPEARETDGVAATCLEDVFRDEVGDVCCEGVSAEDRSIWPVTTRRDSERLLKRFLEGNGATSDVLLEDPREGREVGPRVGGVKPEAPPSVVDSTVISWQGAWGGFREQHTASFYEARTEVDVSVL
jgi:hypothetical protein